MKSNGIKKQQVISVAISMIALAFLYFSFDIAPKKNKDLEKSRTLNAEATSIQNLVREARTVIGDDFKIVEALMIELDDAQEDSLRIKVEERIASQWYELGHPEISAYYAQEIAEKKENADSWSIAGTTYIIAMKGTEKEKVKTWTFNRAVGAFENAISIDPENIDHKINLALTYVENPPTENPMKGIVSLRTLNEKFPDNVKVLNQLGRLSIQTGQMENALKRLKSAELIESNNKTTLCLLAETYIKLGDQENGKVYQDKCLNNKN